MDGVAFGVGVSVGVLFRLVVLTVEEVIAVGVEAMRRTRHVALSKSPSLLEIRKT